MKKRPSKIILATGASEKFLEFPGNDLPGIYGAGAVQTLMNVAGVKPAERVLMVGAGNIGLIVSYQLMQAGVEVAGIIEAAPKIGGYLVHASKIRLSGLGIRSKKRMELMPLRALSSYRLTPSSSLSPARKRRFPAIRSVWQSDWLR